MTPGYSPPEQYGTARTDPRSDIYSLGATLYAALSGVIPEDGLARVMDNLQLTPIRKNNSRISRRLSTTIEKAMEAYPDDRFQSAEEFRNALLYSSSKTLRFVDMDVQISVKPPPGSDGTALVENDEQILSLKPLTHPKTFLDDIVLASMRFRRRLRRFANPLVWLGMIVMLMIGWFLWGNNPRLAGLDPQATNPIIPPPATLTRTVTVLPPIPVSTATITPQPSPTNTPPPTATPLGGGRAELAFVSSRTGVPQVYIMSADGENVQQITNERDGACQPDWSPDGEKIVYVTPCRQKQDIYQGSSLFIIDIATRERTALPASPGGDFEPAWSPDGKRIAFTTLRDNYMEIYYINLENSQFTRLTRAQSIVAASYARQAAWNPYGTQIAYVLRRQGVSQIWVTTDGDANMSKPNNQLVQSGNKVMDSYPTWSSDGQFVLFNETNFDGTAPFQLMSIRYEDRDARQAVPINIEPLPVVDVSISPDGQWLAFESWPDTINQDIFITTVSGASRTRLTTDPGLDFDPVWRPAQKN